MAEREKGFYAHCLKFPLAFERGPEMNRERWFVFVLMLASSTIYGFDGNIVKWIGVEDAVLNSGLRAMGAVIFASGVLLWVKRRLPRFRRDRFFVGAVASSVLCCFAFIFAILYIRVATILMLFHAAILWLTIIKWFVGEPVDEVDRRAGYGVFSGILALCYEKEIAEELHSLLTGGSLGYGHLLGFGSGIVAGMCFAGYLYLSEKSSNQSKDDEWAPLEVFACSQMIIAVLVTVIVSCALAGSEYNTGLDVKASQVAGLVAEGLMYGLAYTLLSWALHLGKPHMVSVFIGAMEPIAGICFGWLILGESLTRQMGVGFLIITAALVYQGFAKRERKDAQES